MKTYNEFQESTNVKPFYYKYGLSVYLGKIALVIEAFLFLYWAGIF